MKVKRTLCFFAALSVLFSLAACGGNSKDRRSEPTPDAQSSVISSDGQWQGKGGCYKLDLVNAGQYYKMKGSPIFLMDERLDRLLNEDGALIYSGFINDYTVTEDGVWCVRDVGFIDGNYSTDCYVLKLGFDGQELARFDISIQGGSIAVVGGSIYIYDAVNKALAVYSADGAELGRVKISGAQIEDFSGSLRAGGDGSVYLLSDVQSGFLLYPVDLSGMSLGPAYTLPEDTEAIGTGTAEHPFILSTRGELAYLDPASGSTESILYWGECGIVSGELSSFIPEGDSFLCLTATGISRLRPAQADEIHPKTKLTLGATMPYDSSSSLAALFNAVSNDYCVEVIDYSQGGKLSPEEAQVKLNTELISGHGPDLVMLSGAGSMQNASVYADMYPLLDADPELSRDDFYGLTAFENSGKLLLAPSHLYISTFGALPSVAGDRTGWTWTEYFALQSQLPADGVMSTYLYADAFLSESLDLYAPHAIDWTNGSCSFDTPEFVRILEAARDGYDPNAPAESNYFLDEVNEMMADGRMILVGTGFLDAESFAQSESLYGPLNYIGWPTPGGSCGSLFRVSGVVINNATSCLNGCWEFAKFTLKSTYAYKPAFEKAMADAVASGSDSEVPSVRLTQAQAERYRKLMETITVAVTDGSEINDIVLREAAAMFAGDKTPEETAKLIQSKLSIYVAEHCG